MALIKGIHHVALKCCSSEEYKNVAEFYGDILGLSVARKWDGGIMFDTGDVDACVSAVRKAGYEVFIEPKDIEIQSDPRFPARIAFCRGPLGEEIEFFCEK